MIIEQFLQKSTSIDVTWGIVFFAPGMISADNFLTFRYFWGISVEGVFWVQINSQSWIIHNILFQKQIFGMLGQSLESFEAFSWVFLTFNGRYWYVFVIVDVIWYIFRILVRWLRICKLKEHILKVNWNISVFPKWPFDSVIHVWRHTQKGFSKPIRSILNDARCHSTRHSICLYSRVYHLHTWRHIVSFSRFQIF